MKNIFLLSALLLSLVSCVSIPDDYQTEIDDAITFYVSAADFLAHHKSDEASKMFINEIVVEQGHSISHFQKQNSNIQESITNALKGNLPTQEDSFKQLLEEKAQANNSFAKEILRIYETKDISLSEFSTLSEKPGSVIGEFTETHSSIRFKFVWKTASAGDMWLIEPNTKDFKTYISTKKNTSVKSSKPSTIQKKETIEDCITNAYSGKYSDKDLMTPAFYEEFHSALKYSNIDHWATYGYWKFEDGTTHKYQIVKCEQIDSTTAAVYLRLTSNREVQSNEIAVYVTKINEKWMISDICGIKNGEILYSIWDFATVLVAECESDHEGNY